jgi:hypothetical protein
MTEIHFDDDNEGAFCAEENVFQQPISGVTSWLNKD